MSNGIRSLPRYQGGGPHPVGRRDLTQEALELMAAAGNMEAAEQLVDRGLSNEHVFRALEGAVPVEEQLSRGIGSLPEEPSWTRGLGIPERGSGDPSLSAED